MRLGSWLLVGWMACTGDEGPDPADSGPGDTGSAPVVEVGVTVPEATLRVVRGSSAELALEITGDGAVDVAVEGLPAGVEVGPASLDVGSGTLTVTAAPTAEPGGPFDVEVTVGQDGVEASASVGLYVAGTPGEPDLSYSFDGSATYVVTDREFDAIRGAALDSQGRLVVVGVGQGAEPWLGWIARLLPDGTIDPSFGDGGEITTFGDESTMSGLVVRPDDGLVVLGQDDTLAATSLLFAFTADGSPDPSFGTSGAKVLAATYNDVAVRPGGFVVSSFTNVAALDAAGDGDGGFTADLTGLSSVSQVAVDAQGRLVAGGFGDGSTFRLVRLLPDGARDTAFGAGGTLDVDIPLGGGDDAFIEAIRLDPNGAGIATAETSLGGGIFDQAPWILRFEADGTVDAGFGAGGLAPMLMAGEAGPSSSLALAGDGRILTAVATSNGSGIDAIHLARFNPDGSPDPTFGDQGRVPLQEFPWTLLYDAAAGRVYVVANQTNGGILAQRFWL